MATPISSGPRRPNRSDSGPVISWPAASPRMQDDKVSWAADVVDPSAPASSGSAGRYMSRQSGPKPDSAPRAMISHRPPPPGRAGLAGRALVRQVGSGTGRGQVRLGHSHSMVPGGLLVTSSTTRLTSGTSPVIRLEILASSSYGSRDQSAVMASSLETGRSTIGWP